MKLLLSSVLFSTFAFALGPAKTFDELPDMYKQAFHVTASLENHDLMIDLETFEGYHVYKDTFLVESDNFYLKLKKASPSFMGIDPVTKKMKPFYKDQNTFLYETSLRDGAPAEMKNLMVSLQACSKDNCLLPVKLSLPVSVVPAMGAIAKDTPMSPELDISTQSGLAEKIKMIFASSGGVLSLKSLLILLFAGMLTAISPCVFPLFPLTLGIFSRWSHHDDKKAFGLTLSYGAGIVLFFAINGLISAATGGIFGALTQNPYYLLTVGLIILLAGLIFSGLIPFPFANQLQSLVGGASGAEEKEQPFGKLIGKSFFMGATLGLVASPCVGPILLALLAWLSQALPHGDIKSYFAGFFALSIFGFGLAIPFLVLGHFFFRLHKRISLGRFTPYAKYAGSALLVGASFFFLAPAYKIFTNRGGPVAETRAFNWENKPTGKWLVVDFRADWCAACQEIEKEVLTQKDVQSYFDKNNWALVQLDMTNPETHEKTAQEYGVISLPTLLFLSPDGKECKKLRLNEKESRENFLKRLQTAEVGCR